MRTAYQLLISTLNCNSLPITPSLYYWFPLIAIFQAKLDQNIPQSALFLISSRREVLRISRNSVFLQITCPSFHSFTLTPFCAQTSLKLPFYQTVDSLRTSMAHTYYSNGHLPDEPGSAGWPQFSCLHPLGKDQKFLYSLISSSLYIPYYCLKMTTIKQHRNIALPHRKSFPASKHLAYIWQ